MRDFLSHPKMSNREPIKLTDTIKDMIWKMSEGNPGAIRVICEILASEEGIPFLIFGLDDMNIRGWQIWVGYKDYCKCDIELFKKKIRERSQEMVDIINNEAKKINSPLIAVCRGASFPEYLR